MVYRQCYISFCLSFLFVPYCCFIQEITSQIGDFFFFFFFFFFLRERETETLIADVQALIVCIKVKVFTELYIFISFE